MTTMDEMVMEATTVEVVIKMKQLLMRFDQGLQACTRLVGSSVFSDKGAFGWVATW